MSGEKRGITIIAGTDFHGSRWAFESFTRNARKYNVDLAVICGDITNFGTVEQARKLLTILSESGIPIIFVPGNCDPPSLIDFKLEGLTCIHGGTYVYGDLIFVGLGGSTITPFNTFFEISEEEMIEILRKCMDNVRSLTQRLGMVFVSHQPPKNTKLDRTFIGVHAGSVSVRKFVEENKPLLVLCGHIHEARGMDHIGNTIIINLGPAKQGNYALVTIRGNEVNIELKREET